MWNILSLQLKASIASWKLERIFRCGFRFQCCIKLCTISQLNCWRYQGWHILLNFTKDRRQFVLVEKSSWGCYHLDPVGASLKGLPFSITWVVHCGHCTLCTLSLPLRPHLFFKVVVLHLRLVSTRVEVLRKKIKLKMSVLRMARWISCQMP